MVAMKPATENDKRRNAALLRFLFQGEPLPGKAPSVAQWYGVAADIED
jgi:hypothetical protein